MPSSLIESALFGHVKGAYTDAHTARMGKFQQADGGTIFFDEIGELPVEVQMKLLRVLQEREVEPMGGTETHAVDVRIIAATNRRLEAAIAPEGVQRRPLLSSQRYSDFSATAPRTERGHPRTDRFVYPPVRRGIPAPGNPYLHGSCQTPHGL